MVLQFIVYVHILIYFVNQPVPVLGMFIAHHQEVFTVYVQQLVRVIHLGDWQLAGSGWNWFCHVDVGVLIGCSGGMWIPQH
jgi:hypothetical protein